MNRETYKKQFDELISPFIEANFLKTIYSDDYVNICNLANTTYALFSYDMLCEGKENFVGILFNGKYLENVIDNPMILLQDYVKADEAKRLNMMVPLNSASFDIMKKMKKQTDIHGPTEEINFQLEQELMSKNKRK